MNTPQRPASLGLLALLFAFACLVPSLTAQKVKDLYDLTVFRTLNLTFAQTNWYTLLVNNKQSETYIKATLVVDGITFKDVGVRARGASAFYGGKQTGKLPLKISFDRFVSGRKFLGRRAMDLNNGYWNPTFMREVLVMKIMREFVPAPGANFVQVNINKANYGVYVNIEVPNRDFADHNYKDGGGNRYKGRSLLRYRGSDPSSYSNYTPLTSTPRSDSYHDLAAALLSTTYSGSKAEIEIPKLNNVDTALKVMAINAAVRNTDAYPNHNYYLYVDPYHKQLEVIPWDVNLCLRSTSVLTSPRFYGHSAKWVRQYQAHLRDAAEIYLDWKRVQAMVTPWHKLIDAAVKADPKKFYSYKMFVDGLTKTVSNYKGLKLAVDDQRKAILNLYGGARVTFSSPTQTPREPASTENVTVTVKAKSTSGISAVKLHWRSVGYFRELTMYDDGKHKDGAANDGVFGATIPFKSSGAQVDYYFTAENTVGTPSFLPISTGHNPYSFRYLKPKLNSVVINELVALNTAGLKDEKGDYEDWIEIYNPTSATIDVGGMFLSDDPLVSKKWVFPKNLNIKPGFSLIVWADDDPKDGPLHTNFKLGDKGEGLYLSAKDGALLDYVEFENQKANVSLGRLEDRHAPTWVSYPTPSPLVRNGLYSCGSRQFSHEDPFAHAMTLSLTGAPKINTKITLNIAGAAKNTGTLLVLGATPQIIPLFGTDVTLFTTPLLIVGLAGTATGATSLPLNVPNDVKLDKLQVVMQVFTVAPTATSASNALQIQVCK